MKWLCFDEGHGNFFTAPQSFQGMVSLWYHNDTIIFFEEQSESPEMLCFDKHHGFPKFYSSQKY